MPTDITVHQYQPSEIINIFNEMLAQQNNRASGKVVCIRGLYLVGSGTSYNGIYYDTLRNEKSIEELQIRISDTLRKELTSGNLADVYGTLGRKITSKGEIKLELNVSRVDVVQEQVIDENEIKRIEYRQRKVAAGFKNVDTLLETLLFNGTRPQIALVIATSSRTLNDFEDGIKAARVALDFYEERVTFTQTKVLCAKLKELDQRGFHAIALVRGGGVDSNTDVDIPEVVETVAGLKTAFISGLGHKDEKIFLRQVADKYTATPQGLGQYFSDLVETVNEKKTKSQAVLTEQIRKQFKDQLEAGQKQNKELQERLAKLTKAQEEAVKKHNEQVQALTKAQTEATKKNKEQVEAIQKQHREQLEKTNKQNEELQKKLTEITKANEAAQKAHVEQLSKLQGQMKAQTEASAKQSKEFGESLKKMQDTNTELNKSLQKLTAQNTQAAKDLQEAKDRARDLEKQLEESLKKHQGCSSGCLGLITAIISIASVACYVLSFII